MGCGAVGFSLPFFTEPSRDKGIYADTRADCHSHNKYLNRESQRNCRKGIGTDSGDEGAVDYASQLGLLISIHCGRDLGFPKQVNATPRRIRRMITDVFPGGCPGNLILAHLGGHDMENESEQLLVGGNYYMDLAYILRLALPGQILRMCRNHGIEKILFATDSPWSGQKEDVDYIRNIGFTEAELEQILYKNGARLLGLPL